MTHERPLPTVALSIRQPWAWAIVAGFKDVENRRRAAVTTADFAGVRVAIHAARGMTMAEYRRAGDVMAEIGVTCPRPDDLVRGAVVGAATVTAVVKASDSPWFTGPRGLVLADAISVDPIPALGALGVFPWTAGGRQADPRPWMTAWPFSHRTRQISIFDVLGHSEDERPRLIRMRVVDAGSFPDGRDCVRLVCRRCHHDTGHVYSRGLTEDKHGWPCPVCNSGYTTSEQGEAPHA